jgi:phenylalanyl-tRNA synthetase beta chain
MAHGLKTDSSFRFERGTDPEMPVFALKKAVNLILEVAGGKVASEVTDIYPAPVNDYIVETSYKGIHRLIGKAIPATEIKTILTELGIKIAEENGDYLKLAVPPFKTDVQREADIVEEIIRIYGFDNIEIPEKISAGFLAGFPAKEPEKIQAVISQFLAAKGFNEIITNSLTKPSYATLLKQEDTTVNILNKLSEDLGVMRQSLLFSGLEVISYNVNRRQKDLKFYEFGKTYFRQDGKYKEESKLAVFISGGEQAESWVDKYTSVSFYNLKQVVSDILLKLGIKNYSGVPANTAFLKYGLSFNLKDKPLVVFGAVSDKAAKAADLKQAVWYAEFDLQLLNRSFSSDIVFEEIAKFPEVRRDLSLVLDTQVSYEQVSQLVWQKEKKLLKTMNVFDVYEGKNLGDGKKSYSLSFILQDNEKTLTDEVIEKTMEKLMQAFEKELGAVIRK